jgi:hypothetical protein
MKVSARPSSVLLMVAFYAATFYLSVGVSLAQSQSDCQKPRPSSIRVPQQEPVYDGRPLSFWLDALRKRDDSTASAFAAVRSLGPLASAAVPVLDSIVGEPFVPVKVGKDTKDVVLAKLRDIQFRADAVDALASIGLDAECSTKTLIRWALTLRVVPSELTSTEDKDMFVELVGVDTLERMRVAGAVPEFGSGALVKAVSLLPSRDSDKRKLAVAILQEKALPLAVSLLKSPDCNDQKLGISILSDMWQVVPEVHLFDLKEAFICTTN